MSEEKNKELENSQNIIAEEMKRNLKAAYKVVDKLDQHSIIDPKILRETVFNI
ncbi:MAG: hypothetical protein WC414_01335 [Patescibacteria group bacterium]